MVQQWFGHMSDGVFLALIGLATVIVAGLPATVTALTARKALLESRDHAKTAADAATQTAETLGTKNGRGDMMQMQAKQLDAIDSLGDRLDKLELRTMVTRSGEVDPEPIGTYTQDRMHELGAAVAKVVVLVDTMYRAIKSDYNLPDLPAAGQETT